MKTGKTCIILTEDYFLYLGMKNLASQFSCTRSDFSGHQVEHRHYHAPLILVDLRILLQQNWCGFDMLKTRYPTSVFLHLSHRSVFGFTSGDGDNNYIYQIMLGSTVSTPYTRETDNYHSAVIKTLTPQEKKLIPYLARGKTIESLSVKFNCSVKTLYSHRNNINTKLGLRHPAYLEFFLNKISLRFFDTKI